MNSKLIFVIVIVIGLTITGVTIPIAIAQETTNTTTSSNEPDSSVLQIDDTTTLKDYEFSSEGVTLYIQADRVRRIKLTDGYALDGTTGAKEIPSKTLTLEEGQNVIQMDLTTVNGKQGVYIATTSGTIGINERTGATSMFSGQTSTRNTVISGIGGGLFGVSLVGVMAYKRRYGISENVEREL